MFTWQDALVAVAPLVVLWLLWRIQSFAVSQVLRGGMYKLLRYQRRTYAVVSWFGVLLHEISHAMFLLIGGHGIRGFKVSIDSGHVVPKQVRSGPFGTLSFILAALAPAFTAPLAIFLLLVLGPGNDWAPMVAAASGLDALVDNLQHALVGVPGLMLDDVIGLDVIAPIGAALFLLAIFAMPSARPSFVKGKDGDEGDIAVVRRTIRRRPIPVLAVVGLAYASYFAMMPWAPGAYWAAWQVLWIVSMLASVLAIMMGLVWYGVAWAGQVQPLLAWIPFAAGIAVQVAGRLLDQPIAWVNIATIVTFVGLTWLLRSVARRRY